MAILKYFLYVVLQFVILIVPILIAVAYFTLAERKILGIIQRRKGPNVIGVYGLLQPLADGFKLFIKESILPSTSDDLVFYLSPLISFIISLLSWIIIPFSKYSTVSEISLGVLYIFAVSSLGVYGVIMSGWSSNSKYAFLGSLRSTAQMVSYEVSIGFILVVLVVSTGSFNLPTIIEHQQTIWFFFPFFPLFLLFFVSSLAETNRHPFDLPEAEAELVSGYNVEYSAMSFALFSLSEYSNMLLISAFNIILFWGGWLLPTTFVSFFKESIITTTLETLSLTTTSFVLYSFGGFICFGIKIVFFVILFVWIRAALPRYRYDQLMDLGWKNFLPFSLSYLIFISCYFYAFNLLPY